MIIVQSTCVCVCGIRLETSHAAPLLGPNQNDIQSVLKVRFAKVKPEELTETQAYLLASYSPFGALST